MRVHALEDRREDAASLVYHEHHVMDQLRIPGEDAGRDQTSSPTCTSAAYQRWRSRSKPPMPERSEVIRGEPEHRVHCVPRLVVEGQVPPNVHVAVPVFVGRRDHRPIDYRAKVRADRARSPTGALRSPSPKVLGTETFLTAYRMHRRALWVNLLSIRSVAHCRVKDSQKNDRIESRSQPWPPPATAGARSILRHSSSIQRDWIPTGSPSRHPAREMCLSDQFSSGRLFWSQSVRSRLNAVGRWLSRRGRSG